MAAVKLSPQDEYSRLRDEVNSSLWAGDSLPVQPVTISGQTIYGGTWTSIIKVPVVLATFAKAHSTELTCDQCCFPDRPDGKVKASPEPSSGLLVMNGERYFAPCCPACREAGLYAVSEAAGINGFVPYSAL